MTLSPTTPAASATPAAPGASAAAAAPAIRVVVVDDDAFVCQSLGIILGAQPDIEVVSCGNDGQQALDLWRLHRPDVVLADIQMPRRDGLWAAERILAEDPAARIVFLTTFSDDEYIVRALKLGARGYLIKQDVATIAPALRSVMAGQRVLEGEVLEKVSPRGDAAGGGPGVRDPLAAARARGLTDRECGIVALVADGLDNADIADRLCLSEGTVRNHISMVLAKLGLRNRTQIAVWYYRTAAGAQALA